MTLLRIVLRPHRTIWFLLVYLWSLAVANAYVAWEVITPRHYLRPGIVEVPIRSRKDLEIFMLANLVTFTPGTLTLGVAKDRSAMYVHGLHVRSPEAFRRSIQRLEDLLLWVVR